MTMQTINATLSAYAEKIRFIDELKAEAEKDKAAIIAYMAENGLTELNGAEHKATYKTVISRRFDQKALEKAAPEVYNEFTKETTSTRFVFK